MLTNAAKMAKTFQYSQLHHIMHENTKVWLMIFIVNMLDDPSFTQFFSGGHFEVRAHFSLMK